VFGQQIALLGFLYGIDIEEQLAATIATGACYRKR
jgi:hypothetical protein